MAFLGKMIKFINKCLAKRWFKFTLGMIFLCPGLWLFIKNVYVVSGRFDSFFIHIGPLTIRSGVLVLPLVAGLIWMFFRPANLGAKKLCVVGLVCVVIYCILSVSIRVASVPLVKWVGILFLLGVGGVLTYAGVYNKKLEIKLK